MYLNVINCGVDLDGVICNFHKKLSEECRKIYGSKCYIINDISEIKSWEWEKWYPLNKSEIEYVIDKMYKTPQFWMTLEPYQLSQFEYFTNRINKHPNINVYFITSRVESVEISVVRQTMSWLDKYGWKNPCVIRSDNKDKVISALNIEYFIDDNAENIINIKNMNPNCNVYIQEAPYNAYTMLHSQISYKKVTGLNTFTDDILNDIGRRNYNSIWKNS